MVSINSIYLIQLYTTVYFIVHSNCILYISDRSDSCIKEIMKMSTYLVEKVNLLEEDTMTKNNDLLFTTLLPYQECQFNSNNYFDKDHQVSIY